MSGIPRGHTDGWSQANQRRYQEMTDDHGRKWGANIEIKTGDPTGLISPMFSAPLIPPQHYLRTVPKKPWAIKIDYEAWLTDTRDAHRAYMQRALQESAARQWPVPEPGEYSAALTSIIGTPPHPLEPIIAAMQGNAYVLGLTNKVDARLVHFFESPVDRMLDFSDVPDYSDVEEEADPDAVGGSRERLSRGKRGATRVGREAA